MNYKKKKKEIMEEFEKAGTQIQSLQSQINQLVALRERLKGQFQLLEEMEKAKK